MMRKVVLIMVLVTAFIYSWEINTHRAIDRKAIEWSLISGNLKTFIKNSGIDNKYKFINENFLTYRMSYYDYITEGEKGGISDWNQSFTGDNNIQDIIEAGTILEDAQWAGGVFAGDGRFNNHFYDPQKGGKGLTIGWGKRTDAISWAKNGGNGVGNSYSFDLARR